MVRVPLKLLTKLASVAGQFFCETASAQLSYFAQHILLIAYRGVSINLLEQRGVPGVNMGESGERV